MIIRITFLDAEQKPFTMLFGDSYKRWRDQFREYLCTQIKWLNSTELISRNIFGILAIHEFDEDWLV